QIDKLEGDIKLSPNVAALVAEGVRRTKRPHTTRGAVNNKIYLWSNGQVPYEIDSVFGKYSYPSDRKAILDAIYEMELISCVRFTPRTNQQYYLRFIRSSGCWSYVGQAQISGGQSVSIGHGCGSIPTVSHELMHALGFFHTSSRYDRDSYVIVRQDNIIQGYEANFQKYTHAQIDRLEAPYDMRSLMHLPQNAFSKNGFSTLEARAGSHVVLGSKSGLSEVDKAQLNLLYGCTGYPSCFKAFGMESFHIPDSQITASSYQQYFEPSRGRLHMTVSASGNGAWCAKQNYQLGEWLQVDLGGLKKVTGFATQGNMDWLRDSWVTNLEVMSSRDSVNWYKEFNGKMVSANIDANSAQYNEAPAPFIARYVRFIPKHWYNDICMRVEIYGCDCKLHFN
ncbi:unnamed protein product, partial [Porites evermanni]